MPLPSREHSADFVVVGTGAGGATAARVLSAAGYSVLMLEEGPQLSPEQRERALLVAMQQSVRDFATTTTSGTTPFPLLQGRVVGGSTAINSGIIWRLPDDVRADWHDRFGLRELISEPALQRIFDTLERELGIGEVSDQLRGGNGHLLALAAERMQLPGRPIRRNAPHCEGHARCLQGCPIGARQSMDVSFIPQAMRDGAELWSLCRATRIHVVHRRAVGVMAQQLDATTRKPIGDVYVRARRAVIVSASAIATPILLLASGIRAHVGERFQAHPGAAVVGRFDTPVEMGFGATQSYEVPLRDRGFKIESLSLPPELLAARLPGAGAVWQERLAHLDRFAQWCSVMRMQALGRVSRGLFGGTHVHYEPTPRDVAVMKESVALIVRMMFAAGATEVYPGVARLPETFTDAAQADLILSPQIQRSDFHLMASHHFGTAGANADAHHGVVNDRLQSHAVQHLYVMDGSVLPTNLGVNPQHTIMALSFRAAELLANEERVRQAA